MNNIAVRTSEKRLNSVQNSVINHRYQIKQRWIGNKNKLEGFSVHKSPTFTMDLML